MAINKKQKPTSVDLGDLRLRADKMAKHHGVSRSDLIPMAVRKYFKSQPTRWP